jgi:DNA-binding NtrC family response regulator
MSTDLRRTNQAGGAIPQEVGGGESDVTIRMLRQQLAKGNLNALPVFIKQARSRAAEADTDQRLATLLLCEAAAAARALGDLKRAGDLLESAHAGLPAFSLDLLALIKRLEARILLDRGDVAGARALSDEIDSYEFVRVRVAEPMFVREDDKVSAETWALIAEIALEEGAQAVAGRALEKAALKLTRDEEERLAALGPGGAAVAAFDADFRRQEQQAAETRHYLRFLEAVWRIREGDESGYGRLEELRERIVEEGKPDAPMTARLLAARGEWHEADGGMQCHTGINVHEARRWHKLGTTPPEAHQQRAEAVAATEDRGEPAPTQDANEITATHRGENENQADLLGTAIARLVDQLEARAAARAQESSPSSSPFPDNFAIGGSFKDFDIFAQIGGAERARLTGYLKATWKGEALEEMIAQGHVHGAARTGSGYVFLREGLIVDATLGTPEAALSVAEARDALSTLLLIGIGAGTAASAEGQGRSYPDASVATRPLRLEVTSNDNFLFTLLNLYEESNKGSQPDSVQTPAEVQHASADTPLPASDRADALLDERDVDTMFDTLEAGAMAEVPDIHIVPGNETGVAAAHFRALLTAQNRRELADALRLALEVYTSGAAFVRVVTGERVAVRVQSSPWTAAQREAAARHTSSIEVGGGLKIVAGTVDEIEPALLHTLLEAASLRLRAMPRAQKFAAPCLTSAAAANVVVHSIKLRSVYDRVGALAPQDGLEGRPLAHILITGETGVGKELVARRIHELSARAGGAFKSINLAGMPKDLIRSAIFGHVKGSFSGATADQLSLFEQTEGGTLLIDEFGELDLSTQAMVLRVLEECEFNRIGESRAVRRLNSRIIFATNRKIDDETIFRPDIKFRCKVIRIPSLREHPEDIRPMAIHFAEGRGMKALEAALLWCEGRPWPGNVRELKAVVEEAAEAARERGDEITLDDVMEATEQYEAQMGNREDAGKSPLVRPGETMAEALNRIERELLQEALDQAGAARGRKTRAAAIFGEKRQTFAAMLKRHGLEFDGD